MTIATAIAIVLAALYFTLGIREKDIPEPIPVSPIQHLEDRKQAIYGNLRDLQFEYRVGKLSDADYQSTKRDLQKELAAVLAEVDSLKLRLNGTAKTVVKAPVPAEPRPSGFVCPSCGARFEKSLKFCGECGKPMKAVSA